MGRHAKILPGTIGEGEGRRKIRFDAAVDMGDGVSRLHGFCKRYTLADVRGQAHSSAVCIACWMVEAGQTFCWVGPTPRSEIAHLGADMVKLVAHQLARQLDAGAYPASAGLAAWTHRAHLRQLLLPRSRLDALGLQFCAVIARFLDEKKPVLLIPCEGVWSSPPTSTLTDRPEH